MLEPFESQNLHPPAVMYRLAGIAVLVDQTVGAPRQVVAERIDRILRQRAHAHVHIAQILEPLRHVGGKDRNEPGRETALGDESGVRTLGDCPDRVRGGDVLGEVEVVGACSASGLGDSGVEVEGQGTHHRLATLHQPGKCCRIGDVGDLGRDFV